MKKLSEWKETGGGSHEPGHARRLPPRPFTLKWSDFLLRVMIPQRTLSATAYPPDYPSVHIITSTREPRGKRESGERSPTIRKNCGRFWYGASELAGCAKTGCNCLLRFVRISSRFLDILWMRDHLQKGMQRRLHSFFNFRVFVLFCVIGIRLSRKQSLWRGVRIYTYTLSYLAKMSYLLIAHFFFFWVVWNTRSSICLCLNNVNLGLCASRSFDNNVIYLH